jgi:hypothetical protein
MEASAAAAAGVTVVVGVVSRMFVRYLG